MNLKVVEMVQPTFSSIFLTLWVVTVIFVYARTSKILHIDEVYVLLSQYCCDRSSSLAQTPLIVVKHVTSE